jgi:hypothetical protein
MIRRLVAVLTVVALCASTASAAELDARLTEVRAIGPSIRVSLDLQDIFSDKFRAILQDGGRLHVRVQTEMWEDRPVWDKLVRPAIVNVFRIIRDPNSQISVSDAVGVVSSAPWTSTAIPVRVDAGPSQDVHDDRKYYLRIVVTVGTIEEREIEETGEAVFGRGESTVSVARVGKLIFNTVLQVSDYLQSQTSEVKSATVLGRELKARR